MDRAAHNLLDDWLRRRVLLVLGKGGVGRTTVAWSLALAAARREQKVLVVGLGTGEPVTAPIGGKTLTPSIIRAHNDLPIDAVRVTRDAMLREYALDIFRLERLYRLVFENRNIKALLRMIPALGDNLLLRKLCKHEAERGPDGRPRWDLIVLDAPATGHGAGLLKLSQFLLGVAPPGLLRQTAQDALALLRDEWRTGALLVALPEEMPVAEALELHQSATETGLATLGAVVNRVYPAVNGVVPDSEALRRLPARARALTDAWTTYHERRELHLQQVAVLAERVDAGLVTLPQLFDARDEHDLVDRLSHQLGEAMS